MMSVQAQLVYASIVVAMTVLTHLVGLAALLALLRRHKRMSSRLLTAIGNAAVVMVAAFGPFALHTVEIWAWAFAYLQLGMFNDLEHALYFSTSTYVTIGYGDVTLPVGSRIFGAIEGANGIILLGWSTAFFFGIVDRLKLLERELIDD